MDGKTLSATENEGNNMRLQLLTPCMGLAGGDRRRSENMNR